MRSSGRSISFFPPGPKPNSPRTSRRSDACWSVTSQTHAGSASSRSTGRATRPCGGIVRRRMSSRSGVQVRQPIAALAELTAKGRPKSRSCGACSSEKDLAGVKAIGIVPPDPSVEEVVPPARRGGRLDPRLPACTVVRTDPHGVEQAKGPGVGMHVLRDAAAQQEPRPCPASRANQFDALTVDLDVCLVRGCGTPRHRNRPPYNPMFGYVCLVAVPAVHAVHLEIGVSPFGRHDVGPIVHEHTPCTSGCVRSRQVPVQTTS